MAEVDGRLERAELRSRRPSPRPPSLLPVATIQAPSRSPSAAFSVIVGRASLRQAPDAGDRLRRGVGDDAGGCRGGERERDDG